MVEKGVKRKDMEGAYEHFAADSAVDAGVRHEMLFVGDGEKGAVGDALLFCAAEGHRWPCIQVGVKVDNGNRSVDFVQRTQDGEDLAGFEYKHRTWNLHDLKLLQ